MTGELLYEVKEIRETEDYVEANKLLDNGWIVLSITVLKTKHFQKLEEYQRVETYERIVKTYILGRVS